MNKSQAHSPQIQDGLVVLVDDDAQIAQALELLLSLRGVRASVHGSAESLLAAVTLEAEQLLIKGDGPQPLPVRAAVVDLNLPGMSGVDLVLRLRDWQPDLRLVMITAAHDELLRERGHELHGVTCLPKPFSLEALERALFGS